MTAVRAGEARPRREAILACAAELFALRGYRATSLADLAPAVGIAKATLFHYFRSKQQMLYELYRQTMELALTRLRAIAAGATDPEETVRRMVFEHTLLILENRALFTIFFDEEGELAPSQLRAIKGQQRAYIELIAGQVRRLKEAGRLQPGLTPRIAVQGLIGMASWVYRWYDPQRTLTPAEIAAELAQLALGGLLRGRPSPVRPEVRR